jgi:soluble lytic murein transglycosylase-like protein
MRKIIACVCALSLGVASIAPATGESAAEFFHKDRMYWSKGQKPPADYTPYGGLDFTAVRHDRANASTRTARTQVPAHRQEVANKVAAHARATLGEQWVPTALKLAKIESGFNCRATGPRTRHGNAKGVLQVMPGSARALGYDHRRLHECDYGIAAGIAHMNACLKSGVRTHAQMAKCHVAGVKGWNTRLSRSAERYKAHYVRLAMR